MTSDERTDMLTLQVDDEHETLNGPVSSLSQLIASLGPCTPSDSSMDEVTASLDAVRDNAEHHFDSEEKMGLYEQIALKLPKDVELLAALQHEHTTLRSMLTRCQALARCCHPTDFPLLRARLELFLQYLHLHEATEDQLMCRARGEDATEI